MSDVFSDKIRQSLRDGYKPRRGHRPVNAFTSTRSRKLRGHAFIALMSLAVAVWVAGGLMSAAAALWHLAGH
jgi:hypothetical protein